MPVVKHSGSAPRAEAVVELLEVEETETAGSDDEEPAPVASTDESNG